MSTAQAATCDFLHFWGKARPAAGAAVAWHPLAYHSLDVAAVARILLDRWPRLREMLAPALGLGESEVSDFIAFLAVLHDLGKFSRPFQKLSPENWPAGLGEITNAPEEPRHDTAGMMLWPRIEEALVNGRWTGAQRRAWQSALAAVTGHHGAPPEIASSSSMITVFGPAAAAARDFAEEAAKCLLCRPLHGFAPDRSLLPERSWLLAGIAVLADWIGSHQGWFPYEPPDQTLDAYWPAALEKAAHAVRQAGVLPTRSAGARSFADLFAGFAPRPAQAWAESVELGSGPVLAVIEDATGSGKTEAALMLAHRLMAAGRAEGVFVALPTMATADAMFERVRDSYRRLYADDAEPPSLALAHSRAGLHSGFRPPAYAPEAEPAETYGGDEDPSSEQASSASANWIGDDRRRAFLADIGVGTVDQAILGVLPSRYQSLRLLGLSGKVLILDEVHAYDAYMQEELKTLIRFQAALGGHTVLLSATLPQEARRRLLEGLWEGVPSGCDDPAAFPRPGAHLIDRAEARSTPLPKTTHARGLEVRRAESEDAAAALAAAAAGGGSAVCWIRNTVDDAFAAWQALRSAGLDPLLFHARFALCDRLRIQERVLTGFGPNGTAEARAGQILIATQVVEQSLDLDFDLMITDLAPIDLVIQRAGRLWRHDRPGRSGPAPLHIVTPAPPDGPDAGWPKTRMPGTAAVYRDPAGLWLTARVLFGDGDRCVLQLPRDLPALIDTVYPEDREPLLPAGLQEAELDRYGRESGERSTARYSLLDPASGYRRQNTPWELDTVIPTRLGRETTTLRLGRWGTDGRVLPWAAGERDGTGMAGDPAAERLLWALSEVGVPASRVSGKAEELPHAAALRAAEASWPRWARKTIPLVVLEQENGAWYGTATKAGEPVPLAYDPRLGLSFPKADGEA